MVIGKMKNIAISKIMIIIYNPLHRLNIYLLLYFHKFSWAFTIRPNDLREDRLPRDITESIHWLVSTRHRSRKRRPFSRYAARHR